MLQQKGWIRTLNTKLPHCLNSMFSKEQIIFTSPHSLLFAPDGYPTATEDSAEIEETVRTGTTRGGDTGSGRDWGPLYGGPQSSLWEDSISLENVGRCSHFLVCRYFSSIGTLGSVIAHRACYEKHIIHYALEIKQVHYFPCSTQCVLTAAYSYMQRVKIISQWLFIAVLRMHNT